MAHVPVEVWHVNRELMAHLRAEKSKEAKRLFRKLDNREFFSNALSYLFSFSLLMAIYSLFIGSILLIIAFVIVAILSMWGSNKLKESAAIILMDYFKQKQKNGSRQKDEEK